MPEMELILAPRTAGRPAQPLTAEYRRDLTAADMDLLASGVTVESAPIVRKTMKERHHSAARCYAQGMKTWEVSAITGYATGTLILLKDDPAFRELIAFYSANETAAYADFIERATTLSISAVNRIQEAFEDEETPVSVPVALEVAKTMADRIGHAPVQRNVNVNTNLDLGARMSAAAKRVGR